MAVNSYVHPCTAQWHPVLYGQRANPPKAERNVARLRVRISETSQDRLHGGALLIRSLRGRTIEAYEPHQGGIFVSIIASCAASAPTEAKPKPRSKKIKRDSVVVIQEAARVGDARFQHFVETGKLLRSE